MAMNLKLPGSALKEDRVRTHTKPEINCRIDAEMDRRLRFYSVQDAQAINERLEELDREWDIERFLETNAASLSPVGILFGATLSRKWFILPLIVSGFFLQHALQGWCPPVRLLRNLGIRTRLEIERERYALKVLRGDFEGLERGERGLVRDSEQLAQALRR